MSQAEKAERFAALHRAPGAFVIPNPWDVGSFRILESLGFKAAATTSAGYAFAQGRRDGRVGRDAHLAHCAEMAAASELPLNADLENGYGDSPDEVAETIRRAIATGLAGASIEDFSGNPDAPLYDKGLAVERIAAAVEAAREAPFPFMLTARAENFLRGNPDLDDTIARLQAFQEAGADVLYAPALRDMQTVRAVCGAVDRPVNVLIGNPRFRPSVGELAEAGASRISLGGSLTLVALGAFIRAARELADDGTFGFLDGAATHMELQSLFPAD